MSTLLPTLPATMPTTMSGGASAPWETYLAGLIVWGSIAAIAALIARFAGVFQMSFGRREVALAVEIDETSRTRTLDYARLETPDSAGRFRPPPVAASPLWAGVAVLIAAFVAVPAALVVPITRSFGDGDLGSLLLMSCTYAVGLLVLAGLHQVLGWRILGMIGIRGPISRSLVVAGLFAVVIVIPLTFAATMLTQLGWHVLRVDRDSTHALLQLMTRTEQSPALLILAILNASILAPIYEELLFRGHLQTALRKITGGRSPWPAILMTSLLFASIHQPWTIIPPIFVLSVAIGYAYERTGSFWVALAIHVCFNTLSTGLFLLARG